LEAAFQWGAEHRSEAAFQWRAEHRLVALIHVVHRHACNRCHVRYLSQYRSHAPIPFLFLFVNVCQCHNRVRSLCRYPSTRYNANPYLFLYRSHVRYRFQYLLIALSASLSVCQYRSLCRNLALFQFLSRALYQFLFQDLANVCLCLFLSHALYQYRSRAQFQFMFRDLLNAYLFQFLYLNQYAFLNQYAVLNLYAVLLLLCVVASVEDWEAMVVEWALAEWVLAEWVLVDTVDAVAVCLAVDPSVLA
jgi:hypothetical protein